MRPRLEKWVEGMAQSMGESAICLSLFTGNFAKGIDSLLQFALAMMLDKPLFLLAPEGVTIPEHVRRAADGIETYQPGNDISFQAATERLLKKAQEKGFCA